MIEFSRFVFHPFFSDWIILLLYWWFLICSVKYYFVRFCSKFIHFHLFSFVLFFQLNTILFRFFKAIWRVLFCFVKISSHFVPFCFSKDVLLSCWWFLICCSVLFFLLRSVLFKISSVFFYYSFRYFKTNCFVVVHPCNFWFG